MNWLQHRQWLICHASALAAEGHGFAVAGLSGGGKSTLMLNLLDRASSDRLERRIIYRFGGGSRNPATLDLVLGLCLRRCGELGGAARHFLRVLDYSPANARARRELRYIYCVTGRVREAYALQVANCPEAWIQGSRYAPVASRMFELGDRLAGHLDFSSLSAEALELGADAVLVNTAIAVATNPVRMAEAFKGAVTSGRTAYEAGLGVASDGAIATSPLTAFLGTDDSK